MALTILFLAITASALIPLEGPVGVHSTLGLLSGSLLTGLALLGPVDGTKLALGASLGLNPALVLGQLALLAASVTTLLSYGRLPVLTLALAGSGVLMLSAHVPALIVASLELQSYTAYGVIASGGLNARRAVGTGTYFLVGAAATASFVVGWALLAQEGDLALLQNPSLPVLG